MIRPLNCPICSKTLPPDAALSVKTFPFCSDRCRVVDLNRWAEGRYAIVDPLDPETAEELRGEIPTVDDEED